MRAAVPPAFTLLRPGPADAAGGTQWRRTQSTSNKTSTKWKKKSTEKWLGRTKRNFTVFKVSYANKIYLLLNIYINTAIFVLYSSVLFHKLTVVYLWLRTSSSPGLAAQASSCSFLKAQSLQVWGAHSCMDGKTCTSSPHSTWYCTKFLSRRLRMSWGQLPSGFWTSSLSLADWTSISRTISIFTEYWTNEVFMQCCPSKIGFGHVPLRHDASFISWDVYHLGFPDVKHSFP